MPSLVDKNTNSFKNEEKEKVSSENKSSHSTISDHTKKEEDTQRGTFSISTKEKATESPCGAKSLKSKAFAQSKKEAFVNGLTKESEEINKEQEDDDKDDSTNEPEPIKTKNKLKLENL